MLHEDNPIIFALSTPAARAALHLHRISGPQCWERVSLRLRHRQGGSFDPTKIVPRRSYYLDLRDEDDQLVDDVLVVFFAGGASYTGEPLVEISSHGNPLITIRIQTELRRLGMLDAQPGEFTQRAYFAGRLDLTQAESIAALVTSDSFGALKLARAGTDGSIERAISPVRAGIVELRAQLEAQIDFAEDEVGAVPWGLLVELCSSGLERLLALEQSYDRGKKIQQGLSVAIIGKPNAGKSSLYNALLKEERALVSAEMGTTRDVLRERLHIHGRDFLMVDTAGIRSTEHKIEQMGISRGQKAAAEADLILVVIDVSTPHWKTLQPLELVQGSEGIFPSSQSTESSGISELSKRMTLVLNKKDCLTPEDLELAKSQAQSHFGSRVIVASREDTSEVEAHLCSLYDRILKPGLTLEPDSTDHPHTSADRGMGATLISARQFDATQRARSHMQKAKELALARSFPEIIASEVLASQAALEDLMGRVDVSEIFETIFSKFCIGK